MAANLNMEMPNFFIGFDLVGQEDLGRPLIDFAKELIKAKNRTDLEYFFHAGETNWQGIYAIYSRTRGNNISMHSTSVY